MNLIPNNKYIIHNIPLNHSQLSIFLNRYGNLYYFNNLIMNTTYIDISQFIITPATEIDEILFGNITTIEDES